MISSDFEKLEKEMSQLWKPNPETTLSEWAVKHVRLFTGTFKPRPYQVEILDSLKDNTTTFLLKSARVGWTQLLTTAIYYYNTSHGLPSRNLLMMPTLSDVDNFSKDTLQAIAIDSGKPELFKSDTVRFKQGIQTTLHMVGSASESALRRISVDNLFCDELSAFASGTTTLGNPFLLAKKRTESSNRRRIACGSTPSTTDNCEMTKLFLSGDQRYFESRCFACGEYHALEWDDMINLDIESSDDVKHKCPHCGYLMSHSRKFEWMEQPDAKWIARAPLNTHVASSFFIWSGYSYDINCRWSDLKTAHIDSLNDESARQVFLNTYLGRTFSPKSFQLNWETFIDNRTSPLQPGFITDDGVVLYAGIDVQKNWFSIQVVQWNKDGVYMPVDWIRLDIDGDIYDEQNWDVLQELLNQPVWNEAGTKSLKIRRAALDTGFATSMGYEFAKKNKIVMCVKGASSIDRDIQTKPSRILTSTKRYQNLWMIGIHKLKLRSLAEFNNPNQSVFPAFPDEYFQSLLCEKMIRNNGKDQFIRTQKENEAFDTILYALFCAEVDNVKGRLGLNKKTKQKD